MSNHPLWFANDAVTSDVLFSTDRALLFDQLLETLLVQLVGTAEHDVLFFHGEIVETNHTRRLKFARLWLRSRSSLRILILFLLLDLVRDPPSGDRSNA